MSALLPSQIVDDDLTIQRWAESDIAPLEGLITNNLEHLRPWMAWAAHEPISAEQRRKLFDRWDRYWASGTGAVYSIRLGDELFGGCAIHRRSEPRGVEIGYWLSEQASGRGIATRASRVLTNAAFRLDDIDFVQISHERSNIRSGAVAQRLGFAPVSVPPLDATRWRIERSSWCRHDRPSGQQR
jgi:ribosomal-protein-serine acetyltransferase